MRASANLGKKCVRDLLLAAEEAVTACDEVLRRAVSTDPRVRQSAIAALDVLYSAAKELRIHHAVALELADPGSVRADSTGEGESR